MVFRSLFAFTKAATHLAAPLSRAISSVSSTIEVQLGCFYPNTNENSTAPINWEETKELRPISPESSSPRLGFGYCRWFQWSPLWPSSNSNDSKAMWFQLLSFLHSLQWSPIIVFLQKHGRINNASLVAYLWVGNSSIFLNKCFWMFNVIDSSLSAFIRWISVTGLPFEARNNEIFWIRSLRLWWINGGR